MAAKLTRNSAFVHFTALARHRIDKVDKSIEANQLSLACQHGLTRNSQETPQWPE